MRIFLAGIMQGSHLGAILHNQDYRSRLKEQLRTHLPTALVYDPLADHANSLDYEADRGRKVFLHHNQMCGEVDVVLAFVPEATMGTAIEMWEAFRNRRVVVTVSPLVHNWAVKFLSDILYPTEDEFQTELRSGRLYERLTALLEARH